MEFCSYKSSYIYPYSSTFEVKNYLKCARRTAIK